MGGFWMSRSSNTPSFFGDIVIVVFVLVQCLDGILTFIGLKVWGEFVVEANPFVGWLISTMRIYLGLATAKLVAIGCGVLLYWYGLHNVIALLTFLYLVFAVLPWMHFFLTL